MIMEYIGYGDLVRIVASHKYHELVMNILTLSLSTHLTNSFSIYVKFVQNMRPEASWWPV